MVRERYNGPRWPTYRYYVHPLTERCGARVELKAFMPVLDVINGQLALTGETARTLGFYPDVPEAQDAARIHRITGVVW